MAVQGQFDAIVLLCFYHAKHQTLLHMEVVFNQGSSFHEHKFAACLSKVLCLTLSLLDKVKYFLVNEFQNFKQCNLH